MAQRARELAKMEDLFVDLKELCAEFETYNNAVFSNQPKTTGELETYHMLIKDLSAMIREKYVVLKKMAASDPSDLQIVDDQMTFFKDNHIKLLSAIVDSLRFKPGVKEESEVKLKPPKLPDIALPTFDGTLEKWISFRDMFESMVHSQASLTNIQKYHYLQSAFKLPASTPNILTNFPLSEDSYQSAWTAVKERYDDKQKLKSTHISQMFNIKKMSSDSASEVRRVLDSFSTVCTTLNQLDADNFDDLFCYVVLQRLDEHTVREYQLDLKTNEPTFDDLKKFLTSYWKSIDHVPDHKKASSSTSKPSDNKSQSNSHPPKRTLTATSGSISCTLCKEKHLLYTCPKFQMKTIRERYDFVMDNKLCVNCLSPAHRSKQCTSLNRCKTCKGLHHTMLHFEKSTSGASCSPASSESTIGIANSMPSNSSSSSRRTETMRSNANSFVPYAESHQSTLHSSVHGAGVMRSTELLSTVRINIFDSQGNPHQCRALLDNGSDSSVISSSLARKLNLNLIDTNIQIIGINEKVTTVKHTTTVDISSHYGPYEKSIQCFVMPTVTGNLPHHVISMDELNIPSNRTLADPEFRFPAKVDLLLSVSIFYDVLLSDKIELDEGPMLIHTKFGWIVGGKLNYTSSLLPNFNFKCHIGTQSSDSDPDDHDNLDSKLEKFMQVENYGSTSKILSPEEKFCEELFQRTTHQAKDGRYIVTLPLKSNIDQLGTNLSKAYRQFYYQEKAREADPELKSLYVAYMKDFIDSGHMEKVDSSRQSEGHFLPHHGVKNVSSTTTKIRPVFNASCKSETGVTLNDCMCVGPTVQPESVDILIRFREKRYVLKGDIEKMYRQVFVEPSQRKYQKILWREDPSLSIQHYQINVVVFGIASSPFLATRTLNQIAEENAERFPKVARIIRSSIYVDDILESFDEEQDALIERDQLRLVLAESQMPTRKWCSNSIKLLENLRESQIEVLENSQSSIKTLGLNWFPTADKLSCNFKSASDTPVTKTTVLSELASVYDPIGLVGPIVLKMKIFMKTLWELKLKWTDLLPEQQLNEWKEFQDNIETLNEIKIDRHMLLLNPIHIEMHGFCDASESGYGAVIYLRSTDAVGNVQVSLLCSKSRVSPPKQKSIARLELCSATLLSKLITRMHSVLRSNINETILWSDSMITLYWIKTMPSKLGTFVGNRVAFIQEHTEKFVWKHIRTDENPADMISRGLMPQDIKDCTIWWSGPSFFTSDVTQWPESLITIDENDAVYISEFKRCFVASITNDMCEYIQSRFSSLRKLVGVIANVKRFIHNVRSKRTGSARRVGSLSIEELDQARFHIIRILQQEMFPLEYKFFVKLRENINLQDKFPKKSNLHQLAPFMDTDGLIRTRGRIAKSDVLSFDQKHQIILPEGRFTKLIVRDLHQKHAHPGRKHMLSLVREQYWPLRVGSTINQVAHECIKCFRVNPKLIQQFMGSLPPARVTSSPPFSSTAVDYTGHFSIKSGLARNSSSTKSYIAVFKCMSTGAIHLELVTSLSTPSFEMTYDRFISRRGNCREIYSDNATNFEGTDNDFKKIISETEVHLAEYLKDRSIEWKFSPPRAPHYGGIYESGVKTIKRHLKRILDDHLFTFEEFTTILCRVEAIVNSRPLTPMSEDPHDLQVLTPGHFLIGRPLVARPERNYIFIKENRLKKYELMQQVQQKFWDSWYHDYLHHLQQRPINFRDVQEVLVGDMVLLKDTNLPPLKWLMGRIVEVFPDQHKVVRQVRVQTIHGIKDRHVKYLCLLPFERHL
jgi:hypothetical protein